MINALVIGLVIVGYCQHHGLFNLGLLFALYSMIHYEEIVSKVLLHKAYMKIEEEVGSPAVSWRSACTRGRHVFSKFSWLRAM